MTGGRAVQHPEIRKTVCESIDWRPDFEHGRVYTSISHGPIGHGVKGKERPFGADYCLAVLNGSLAVPCHWMSSNSVCV